jgi:hypothetical protein
MPIVIFLRCIYLILTVSKGNLIVEFYSERSIEEFGKNIDQQVTYITNGILPVLSMDSNASKDPSSHHGQSLDYKRTSEGNNFTFVLQFIVDIFRKNVSDICVSSHFIDRE